MKKEPTKQPQTVKAAPQPEPQIEKVEPQEDIYPIGEIIENATSIFTQPPDIVAAALTHAGITETSIDQARKVVKAFAERKV